ncbi:MAG: beta-N-acetylhexosaminidase [Coxiella sp. RIFCSPHIGHO2_12_FULL_44_14]|nr:MAG: beta-N-acetylhexosaminidase [Coxiella sp. RIFCSPHIGHO2_12_FULL_44_14]
MSGFILLDLEGFSLTTEERELLKHPAVGGVILFTRNYSDKAQLRALTHSIHRVRDGLPMLVDQEGGRVQRFRSGFTELPSMRYWGECYLVSAVDTERRLQQTIHTMVSELKSVGVHASLIPVLDVDHGINPAVGERSFGKTADQVTALANLMIDHLHAAGMPAIGKHYPGHGGVAVDSHRALPIDSRARDSLWDDLRPFMQLSHKLDAIMPAHVIYREWDSQLAGFSSFWLQDMLRHRLHFTGIIISDDLSMEAAASSGDYPTRAALALEAGCDLLSICNNRVGAVQVLDALERHRNPVSEARIQQWISKVVS